MLHGVDDLARLVERGPETGFNFGPQIARDALSSPCNQRLALLVRDGELQARELPMNEHSNSTLPQVVQADDTHFETFVFVPLEERALHFCDQRVFRVLLTLVLNRVTEEHVEVIEMKRVHHVDA